MSRELNGEFFIGESWVFRGAARDSQNAVIPLSSGSKAELRITRDNTIAATIDTDNNGRIVDVNRGTYELELSPDDQVSLDLSPGRYTYEVRVVLSTGRVSIQNHGVLTIKASKFAGFPAA